MKFARVLQINESKDNAQRILTLEYYNIKKNKEGIWIGTPKVVERSINDVIPIDKAINESLMNLNLSKTEEDDTDEVHEVDGNIINEETKEENTEEITGNENLNHNDIHESKEDDDSNDKNDNHESIDQIPVRRSERIRKRLKDISPEDIGDNDNAKDKVIKDNITTQAWRKKKP